MYIDINVDEIKYIFHGYEPNIFSVIQISIPKLSFSENNEWKNIYKATGLILTDVRYSKHNHHILSSQQLSVAMQLETKVTMNTYENIFVYMYLWKDL